MDLRGVELGKDCVFHKDWDGLTKLATWMKELGRVYKKSNGRSHFASFLAKVELVR
ncbi:hypothetical protein [Ammoniphilus sp. 3BR4]|uniref:hypothetical protein n=1 Tax=Ammoniphilus sp. 3BR4 TaxID=3158265 RepID=UPI0034679AD9